MHFIPPMALLELFDGIEKVFKDRTHRLCPPAGHLLIMRELSLLATSILCPLWNHTWWQGKQLFLIRMDFHIVCHIYAQWPSTSCTTSLVNSLGEQSPIPLPSLVSDGNGIGHFSPRLVVTNIKITTYEQSRRSNRRSAGRSGDERQSWTWRTTRTSGCEPCQRV